MVSFAHSTAPILIYHGHGAIGLKTNLVAMIRQRKIRVIDGAVVIISLVLERTLSISVLFNPPLKPHRVAQPCGLSVYLQQSCVLLTLFGSSQPKSCVLGSLQPFPLLSLTFVV